MMLSGFRVVEANSWPKMQLSKDCPVTDDFRVEMNDWMRDFFGVDCLVPRWQMILDKLNRVLYVHPADLPILKAACK